MGPLKIEQPWSRPTPAGAPTAVGYLTVANTGGAPDRLLGAVSPDAERIEVHSMSVAGGVMRMRPIAGGLAIGPGKTVEAQPDSGVHLMFVHPKRPFRIGDQIPATLRFEHAGEVKVEFYVQEGART